MTYHMTKASIEQDTQKGGISLSKEYLVHAINHRLGSS